jgi:P27 family predicted phage terminase small subunit
MPGPPRKPTALKLIEGNPGKKALPKNEPEPESLNGLPDAPKRFNRDAKDEWNRTGPVLFRAGLITRADLPMFEAYCEAWGGYVSAQRTYADAPLVEGQKGNLVRNPAAQISRDNLDKAISLAREFGMTPASRTRIDLPGGGQAVGGLESVLTG